MQVAASTVLAPTLTGPLRGLAVVAAGTAAVYLTDSDGLLLAVCASGAVPVSCGLVLPPGRRPEVLFRPGEEALAGHGSLQTGPRRLVVTRWWPPARVGPFGSHDPVPLPPAPRELLRRLISAADAPVDEAAYRARRAAVPAADAVAHGDGEAAERLLTGVLGLGPGLTPSGDDVAAGLLLVLYAVLGAGSPQLGPLAAAVVAAARSRTTAVSAALLAEAAAGRTSAPVAVAVRALLGQPVPGSPVDAFTALLALGHSSGADLATGMLAAADAFAAPRVHRKSA